MWPRARRPVVYGVAAVAGLALAVSSVNFYFFEYTPQHYYGDLNTEVAVELGTYLATVPRDARVYFMGLPRMFYGFPSIPYLSHNLPGVDVYPGDNIKRIVTPGHEAIFVAVPEREAQLDRIRALYPGGRVLTVHRHFVPAEVLYTAYVVPHPPG